MSDIDDLFNMMNDLSGVLQAAAQALVAQVGRLDNIDHELEHLRDRLTLIEKNWE